jgi:hypothetical protein
LDRADVFGESEDPDAATAIIGMASIENTTSAGIIAKAKAASMSIERVVDLAATASWLRSLPAMPIHREERLSNLCC